MPGKSSVWRSLSGGCEVAPACAGLEMIRSVWRLSLLIEL